MPDGEQQSTRGVFCTLDPEKQAAVRTYAGPQDHAPSVALALLSLKMRRHYGTKLGCEPNFLFRADGTAQVRTHDGRTVELTVADVEVFRNAE